MHDHADVIVVGGRIAGAATAIHLAREGLRVQVVDKARFPSDTASTHIIQPRGTAALQRLGVLDDLRRAGAADIDGVLLQYEDARLEARYADARAGSLLSTGHTPGLSLRRRTLDATLLAAAEDTGVRVRTGTNVTALLRDRTGRVGGVRTRHGDLRARVVVGADGRDSTVARLVGAREYETYDASRLAAWTYFAGAAPDQNRLRIGRFGDVALIATPAGEDLLLVGVVPDLTARGAFVRDRDSQFSAHLRRWPELDELVAGARRVGPMRVVPDWRAYFRQSAGPGWVLTGDAGNFKDPAAAQGITDALRQAETLAAAVVADFDQVDAVTRRWWRWRDDDCRDMHWFARDMGAGGATTPVMAQTIRDVADRDQLLFAAVLNRDLPSTAVVTPARVLPAAARVLSRRPGASLAVGREALRLADTGVRRAAWSLRRTRLTRT